MNEHSQVALLEKSGRNKAQAQNRTEGEIYISCSLSQ